VGREVGSNRQRDRETEVALANEDRRLIVVWEHDEISDAADRVDRLVRSNR
jgi:G:T-mismatch repair DNA endonuclease (very short patch repair protein)